jgi:hypothetical protein
LNLRPGRIVNHLGGALRGQDRECRPRYKHPDRLFERHPAGPDGDQSITELDALIESTSERQNVLVVATAVSFEPDSDLDNIFGIKLALPGAEVIGENRRDIPDNQPDVQRMMAEVARFYLQEAKRRGFRVEDKSDDEFCVAILKEAMNPAEVEDIVVMCETAALFRRRTGRASELIFTREILDTAIARVVIG